MSTREQYDGELVFGVELATLRGEIAADLRREMEAFVTRAVHEEVERVGTAEKRLKEMIHEGAGLALKESGGLLLTQAHVEDAVKDAFRAVTIPDERTIRELARKEAELLPSVVPTAELRLAVAEELEARGYKGDGLADVIDQVLARIEKSWSTFHHLDEQIAKRLEDTFARIVAERGGLSLRGGETENPESARVTAGMPAVSREDYDLERDGRASVAVVPATQPVAPPNSPARALVGRVRREWLGFAAGVLAVMLAIGGFRLLSEFRRDDAGPRTENPTPQDTLQSKVGDPVDPAVTLDSRLDEYRSRMSTGDLEPLLGTLRSRGSATVKQLAGEFQPPGFPPSKQGTFEAALVQAALGGNLEIDGDIKRDPCRQSTCPAILAYWRERAGTNGYPAEITATDQALRNIERLIILDALKAGRALDGQ